MNFNTKLPWEDGYVESPTSGHNSPIITPFPWYVKVKQWLKTPAAKRMLMICLGGFLLLFIIFLVWFMFFRTVEKSATVGQMRWERQIEIEQFRTIEDRDWAGQEPDDARVYDTRSEVHHYDRVLSHYRTVSYTYSCGTTQQPRTCTGTRSEPVYISVPVYRNRLYYKVDRWVTDEWVVVKSVELQPYWPDLPPGLNAKNVLGNRREGDRKLQHYEMDIHCDGCDPAVIELNHNSWTTYKPGQKVIAYVTVTGHVRGVSVIPETA